MIVATQDFSTIKNKCYFNEIKIIIDDIRKNLKLIPFLGIY